MIMNTQTRTHSSACSFDYYFILLDSEVVFTERNTSKQIII